MDGQREVHEYPGNLSAMLFLECSQGLFVLSAKWTLEVGEFDDLNPRRRITISDASIRNRPPIPNVFWLRYCRPGWRRRSELSVKG